MAVNSENRATDHVQAHVEALQEEKVARIKPDAAGIISENDPLLVQRASRIKVEISEKDNTNCEEIKPIHYLFLPVIWTIATWSQVKVAIWTLVHFIVHSESIDGMKVYKWLDIRAALRTWWCVPDKTKAEVLRPKIGSIFYDGSSETLKRLRQGAASFMALDVIYHHKFGTIPGFEGALTDFWLKFRNPGAIRNRHKVSKQLLSEAIRGRISTNRTIRLLSVACGSARAVVETIRDFEESENIKFDVTLIDLDQSALDYANKLVIEYGLKSSFHTLKMSASELESLGQSNFDVIEMLGFLDYRVFPKAVALITRLRGMLNEGGIFLTCNILPNPEARFIRYTVAWPMVYRSPVDLAKILIAAGFDSDEIRLVVEPLKIHLLALCKTRS